MSKTKLIIDTDPGIDDAMAIIYAMLAPDIELLGLTTIFGNVTIDIATRNALVLTEMVGQNVPVARGADKPLVQAPNEVSSHVHGVEGFGDLPAMQPDGAAVSKSAAEFICEQINAFPGEVVLCPVGPLTNIAKALEIDPSISEKVKRVVLMGGALDMGNVTPYAEANIWNDPHAADIVFKVDWPITMVGLNITTKITCVTQEFQAVAKLAPKLGGFLEKASEFYIDFYLNAVGLEGCSLHDPTAVIACTHPDLFLVEKHRIDVIVDGEQVGNTVRSSDERRLEAAVCMDGDVAAIKSLFLDVLKTGF